MFRDAVKNRSYGDETKSSFLKTHRSASLNTNGRSCELTKPSQDGAKTTPFPTIKFLHRRGVKTGYVIVMIFSIECTRAECMMTE